MANWHGDGQGAQGRTLAREDGLLGMAVIGQVFRQQQERGGFGDPSKQGLERACEAHVQ